jgi:hypothetical protein
MKNVFRAVAFSSLLVSGISFGAALDNHPELKAAHQAIATAHVSLKAANDHKKTEFGGHRVKAEQLLNEAQKEIEAAAEYANSPANK